MDLGEDSCEDPYWGSYFGSSEAEDMETENGSVVDCSEEMDSTPTVFSWDPWESYDWEAHGW